jgi:hypothetical protein
LAWNDTYSISLLDEELNITKTITEIYFDMLQNTIDREIEFIEEYKY